MPKYLTLPVALILFPLFSFGQISVTGLVVEKGGELAYPGVIITEKGTKNGTVTDFNGKFAMTVSKPDAILVFAALGMVTKEVNLRGQDELRVELKMACTKDSFDHQHIGLLANSGVINTPVGGQLEFSFPAFFRSTTLKTEISYQTNLQENEFLTAAVALDHVIFKCDFEMDLKWYYREVSFNNEFESAAYSIESVFIFDFLNPNFIYSPGLIVGYGGLDYKETGSPDSEEFIGPVLGLRANVHGLQDSEISAKVGLFKDMIEYQGQFRFNYWKLAAFAKFYQLGSYKELSIGIGMNLNYRLKRQRIN